MTKAKELISKISLSKLRAQPWADRVSDVLSVTGSIAEVAGAAGLPLAGLVGLALKLGAGVLKTDDVTKIKDVVTDHYEEIKSVVGEIDESLIKLRDDVISILVLVLDTQYRNGILSVEAAFETFLNIDGSSRGLAEKLEEFRSHKFELEKDYRQHMSPSKVEEYLTVVYKQQGVRSCVSLWDFISLVQVKYLNMFLLYYFYSDNITGAINQYDQFCFHYHELARRVKRVISPNSLIPLYKFGRHCYRNITQLTVACLHNDPELVEVLVTRLGADVGVKCSRRNRHQGRADLTGLSLLFVSAEAGSDEVCRVLLEDLGLSPDVPADNGFTPVFTAAQFGQSRSLTVLAQFGADFKRGVGTTTPLDVAKQYKHDQAAEMIRSHLKCLE